MLSRAVSRSAWLAWAAARLDSTLRRIRPHRSGSQETSIGSWKVEVVRPALKVLVPTVADCRDRVNPSPTVIVGK